MGGQQFPSNRTPALLLLLASARATSDSALVVVGDELGPAGGRSASYPRSVVGVILIKDLGDLAKVLFFCYSPCLELKNLVLREEQQQQQQRWRRRRRRQSELESPPSWQSKRSKLCKGGGKGGLRGGRQQDYE